MCLQLGKIFNRSRVVAKKIHGIDVLAVADLEVHFADDVLYTDIVIESVGNIDRLSIVRGKTLAVAGNRGTRERTACNLQAGRTDRDPSGLQIGNCIGNAAGTVAGSRERTKT